MALTLTPEQAAIQNQVAPGGDPLTGAVAQPAPAAAQATIPGQGPLSSPMDAADAAMQLRVQQPAPTSTFGQSLAKALNNPANGVPLKANGKPQPGAWARTVLAAVPEALNGLGDAAAVGKVPAGAGALYGVNRTLAAGNERQAADKAAKAKQAEMDAEGQREQARLDLETQKQQAMMAQSNAELHHQEKRAHELNINDPMIAQGTKAVGIITNPQSGHPAPVAGEGLTDQEVKQGVIDGKWNTHDFTVFPTSKEVAGQDNNGDPIYRNLYTVVSNGGPITLDGEKDADTLKFMNDNLGAGQQTIQPGQTFENLAQFNRVYQTAANNYTANEDRKRILVEQGLKTQAEADQMAAIAVRPDIQNAMTQFHGDIGVAYDAIMAQANNDPKFAARAGSVINDFREFMGKDKDGKSEFDKIIEKRQTNISDSNKALKGYHDNPDKLSGDNANSAIAAANSYIDDPNTPAAIKDQWRQVKKIAQQSHDLTIQDKKDLKKVSESDYTGDLTLSGDAYLNSIPPKGREAVRMIGEGNFAINNLGYLIAKNPDIIDSVARAFPDFSGSKITSLVDVNKDFTSKQTAKQMLAVGTALQHLKELYDATTLGSFAPGTKAHQDRQAALLDASTELARYLSGGNQPRKEEVEDAQKSLSAEGVTPGAWREGIVKQAKLVGEKMESYQQQWDNAMPSPQFAAHNPMPNISQKSKDAYQFLINNGQMPGSQNANTAVTSATMPKPVLPPPAPGVTRLYDATGKPHDIPNANVAAAQKKYPELKAAR